MHGSIQSVKTSAVVRESIEQTLTQAFAAALSARTGEAVLVRHTSAPELPAGSSVWFLSEFDEFSGASLLLGGSREVWLSTGRKLLAGRGSIEANDETALSAIREMVAKGVNTLASVLSSKLKRGIAAKPPRELSTAPDSVSVDALTGLEIDFRDETRVALHLFVDSKLIAEVCAAEKDGFSGFSVNTKNLDLLLDVEMPVSVSFGCAQLPLKHLIKLTTGSIVELGRSVSEPVDIIVNNTIIARGEVVVVGGNFGVRIKEILSKQDRLRTLT